jgi:hypothetical protein
MIHVDGVACGDPLHRIRLPPLEHSGKQGHHQQTIDLDPRISHHPPSEQPTAAQPNPLTGDRQLHLQLSISTKVSQKKETKTEILEKEPPSTLIIEGGGGLPLQPLLRPEKLERVEEEP